MPGPQVGLQQGILDNFTLGVTAPYPNHLGRHWFEVLYGAGVVAAGERRKPLDHGWYHLTGRHLALGQALAKLRAQPGEGLCITSGRIGQGTVHVRKRDASPWEGLRGEGRHSLA